MVCAYVSTNNTDPLVPGLDQVDNRDMTPLMTAVAAGNVEMAWYLASVLGSRSERPMPQDSAISTRSA